MGRNKYNLHSAMSDNKFLKNLLEHNSPGHAQQASDQNSSGSDFDCGVSMNTSKSNDASTQACSFDRLVVDSPSTSTDKIVTLGTQSLINQTAIGERFDKIEQKTVKKTSGPHKSKSRSAVTKNTKVVRMHAIVTNTHTVLSTVSLPILEHLRANYNIQKAVADRLLELQHLNSTCMSPKNLI